MVEEVLIRHPDIGFISNVDAYIPLNLKGQWNNRLYRRVPTQLKQRDRMGLNLIQRRFHFGPSEAYNLFNREVSPLFSRPWRDLTADDVTPWLASRFRRFFEERATAQRKPLFVHKYTGWPRADFIHAIIPDAKFLHVIRDGRAVASSLVQRPHWPGYLGPWGWGHGPLPEELEKEWEASGHSFVVLAALDWKLTMDAFEVARTKVPPDQWMDMRYEDFIDRPRESVRDILEFGHLPWTDKFEKGFAKYHFSKSRMAGYQRDLTSAQLEQVERVLGDHLSQLGYQTS